METGIGRRVFVGSVAAGLPLLASSTAGAARAGWQAHVHPGGGLPDPLLEHIVRQMAVAHNEIRRLPRGEHMRAFASQVRTLAVYGRSIDLDAKLTHAARQLIERDGRDAVLYTEPNRDQLRAELKRYGAQPDDRLLDRPLTLDYAGRSALLDGVLASGIIVHLERTAALMERVAAELDRRTGNGVRVNRQDAEFWNAYCREIWEQFEEAQFMAALNCAAAAIPVVGAVFAPLCASYSLTSLIFVLLYGAACWN